MHKLRIEICLDVIMAVLLLLMYQKNVITISFHEIGSLILFGLVVVHLLVHRTWVCAVIKNIFRKRTAPKVRFMAVLNVSLMILFIAVTLSGVFISKTILTEISGDVSFWRPLHYFTAAVCLILCGVHLGIHRTFFLRRIAPLKKWGEPFMTAAKVCGIALLVVILAFGCYNLVSGTFSAWLTGPFTGDEAGDGGGHGLKDGTGAGKGNGLHLEKEGAAGGVIAPMNSINVIAVYGSIMMVFAAVTAAGEYLLVCHRRRRRAARF